MTDPRDLRVSDAEREHVVSLLNKAVGRGLITLDEFTSRTDNALAAKTRAELNAVLIDLPGMVNSEIAVAGGPLELKNTLSSTSRKGFWAVPREMVIRNWMGSTKLDFTEADIPHAVVSIELDVTAGDVKLLVPEGSTADINAVAVAAGELKSKIGDHAGSPHFVLTGSVRAGSVLVRNKRHLFR